VAIIFADEAFGTGVVVGAGGLALKGGAYGSVRTLDVTGASFCALAKVRVAVFTGRAITVVYAELRTLTRA
jgi:hypothetical protein